MVIIIINCIFICWNWQPYPEADSESGIPALPGEISERKGEAMQGWDFKKGTAEGSWFGGRGWDYLSHFTWGKGAGFPKLTLGNFWQRTGPHPP